MRQEISRIGHWVDVEKLPDNPVIVDAGACWGEFIDRIKELKDCYVVAIEPNPKSIEVLTEKANVFFEAALVGRSMPKEMVLYDYAQRERANLFGLYPNSNDSYPVRTITLDDVFNKVERIDLLKLDIEGAEDDLFKTITQDEASKIDQICMEVHSNVSQEELINKLKELGFSVEVMPRSEIYAIRNSNESR